MINRADYLPAAGDRIGGFMLLEPLGRGAMGQVYRAKDETLGREVAIKFIDLSGLKNEYLINEVKKRFIREARVLAAINHTNVVEIYSASLEFRCPYIVMQFFEGRPLYEYQDEVGVIDYKRTCVCSLQMCEALDYCWENYQVMHRDLKPANIMINDSGHIKIIDWGIAKVTKDLTMGVSLATKSDMRLGTPHFMAPEQQINPGEVTYLADIYSMGMIMWQMLVGTLPFNANSEAVIFSQKQKGPEKNLTRLIPELPETIADLIYRMLEPNPLERIDSYAEIRSILQREINTFEDRDNLFPKGDRPKIILKPMQTGAIPAVKPPVGRDVPNLPQKPAPPAKAFAPPSGLQTDHQHPTTLGGENQAPAKEKRLLIIHPPAPDTDDDQIQPLRDGELKDVAPLEDTLIPPRPRGPSGDAIGSEDLNLVELPDSQAIDAEFGPGRELGDYRIVQRIGVGGLGVVMRAEEKSTGKEVAMKILICNPSSIRKRLRQVQADDQVIGGLEHNSVAHVHESCNIDGFNIVITDLHMGAEGKPINLWECCKMYGNQTGQLNQYDLRSLVLILLEALTHIHGKGIIHCDIKPDNILFATANGTRRKWYSELKLTDTGVARLIGESTHHDAIRKSLRYANAPQHMKPDIKALVTSYDFMSPEQRRGEHAVIQSDLYSAGLIILRALTGESHLSIHKRPSTTRTGIDPAWDHVILRALKEDINDRYHSAAEMAADIANMPF